jgi:hypothetical protein
VAHIAEAYFHLKPFEASGEDLQRLGRQVSAIAAQAASGLFKPDCEIEVRLEHGSLKGWAAVWAVLSTVYGSIAVYKELREATPLIVHDAQLYGDRVIERFLRDNRIAPRQVFRTERRTKTPGRLLKLLERREWLESHRSQLGAEAIKRESDAIEAQTKNVLEDLDPEEQRVVRKLLQGETMNLSDQKRGPLRAQEEEPVAIVEDHSVSQLFEDKIAGLGETKSEFNARFKLSEWSTRKVTSEPLAQN